MLFLKLFALFAAMGIWAFSILWNLNKALDTSNRLNEYKHLAAAAVIALIGITLLAHYAYKQEEEAPCVKYETTMQYNAATKTMMPVRYCMLRGEWEK